ncbi:MULTISPECIES: chemotaxis protein CheW [Haloarcula]|uniref:chemotaxis protein CheW n=1 Tax=Haloarcula TaxID=2237 RepID=UPI0023E8FB2E|nr:chemotaxis protein CheW [Halomicroarcula sp. SHR3]
MTAAVAGDALPEQVLEFTLGAERYCVGLDDVEEIVTADSVTPLPNTAPAVAGVMDLRGSTTTIIDPSVVLEVPDTHQYQQVVVFDGEDRLGWLVDSVERVSGFRDAAVDTVPDSPYLNGVISDDGQFTIWLDPAAVTSAVDAA